MCTSIGIPFIASISNACAIGIMRNGWIRWKRGENQPFEVNDIVRSVDPVKLYEYIWLGKPILCVRYPEIERFDPFVLFYRTQEEYKQQLEAVMAKEKIKYSNEQAACFLAENNWEKRAEQAAAFIHQKNIAWERK